jgi:hypothetical protein
MPGLASSLFVNFNVTRKGGAKCQMLISIARNGCVRASRDIVQFKNRPLDLRTSHYALCRISFLPLSYFPVYHLVMSQGWIDDEFQKTKRQAQEASERDARDKRNLELIAANGRGTLEQVALALKRDVEKWNEKFVSDTSRHFKFRQDVAGVTIEGRSGVVNLQYNPSTPGIQIIHTQTPLVGGAPYTTRTTLNLKVAAQDNIVLTARHGAETRSADDVSKAILLALDSRDSLGF